ncbi:MAG: DUF559 domain-containing protein [Clostridia bacterium]|nr:DUF559 domain-containing protein [Clostridia bacterium]
MFPYKRRLKKYAQNLRKHMTSEERDLWYKFLKRFPVTVKRQVMIGEYIVDFYIAARKSVIEIDGLQHERQEDKQKDEKRDGELQKLGITVLRYTNQEINENFNAIGEDILRRLQISLEMLKDE